MEVGRGQDVGFLLLRHDASEPYAIAHAGSMRMCPQSRFPVAVTSHSQVNVRKLFPQCRDRIDGLLHPLVGHQAPQHHQRRSGWARHGNMRFGQRIDPRVHHPNPIRGNAEINEFVSGGLADSQKLGLAIHPGAGCRFQPPAQRTLLRPQHLRPLLAMHMVHQVEYRRASRQR